MISKIKLLKRIGKFYDFAAKGDGFDWHKNTFVFAPNAYGKTTLVNVCQSVGDDNPNAVLARKTLGSSGAPEAVLSIDRQDHVFGASGWNKTYPRIQVFDAPYIHRNLLSHEIDFEHRKNIHRIVIGAPGVKLAEELSNLKAEEKRERKRAQVLGAKFEEARFESFTAKEFLAIDPAEEESVPLRIAKLEKDIETKTTEAKARALELPRAVLTPRFDLSAIRASATRKLAAAHETAAGLVLEHVKKNISEPSSATQFITLGLDLTKTDCPFCGQDLKVVDHLTRAYQQYFDESYRSLQAELSKTVSTLNSWDVQTELASLKSVSDLNTSAFRQWAPYIGEGNLPNLSNRAEEAKTSLPKLIGFAAAELEKRKNDPYCENDLSALEAIDQELESLGDAIATHNKAVEKYLIAAKTYLADLPDADLDTLRAELKREREVERRFNEEWKTWATDYPAVKAATTEVAKQKRRKQTQLKDYTKAVFDTYQQRINELLKTLGASFQITGLQGKADERANESYSDFRILILKSRVPLKAHQDDAPCFKNTLSEGDKSTLAFAFFIASLENGPALEDQVVILDDPLSSLDQTRREATARLLLDLTPKIDQLCVFTHKRDFLWMLCDKIPDNRVFQVRSDTTNGSWIEPLDVEEDRKSRYAKIVESMTRYVEEDFGPTPETIQGNIRRLFEVVLKTKYYRPLINDIRQKKGFASLLQTLFEEGLLDVALQPRLFDLCNVTNGPHHGEIVDAPSRNLTRDELLPLVSEALDLIERV